MPRMQAGMERGKSTMTKTQRFQNLEKRIPQNYERNPQYLKYVELLRQYFEIKNDEEKSQRKFDEITTQHQKLVQARIIVI